MGRPITLKKCLFCKELKYCDRKFCSLECYWKYKKTQIPHNKKYFSGIPYTLIQKWRKIARKNYLKKLENQNKVKARAALNHALRTGEVQRQPCEVCGNEKVEAHHHKGYAKKYWLEVQWLCKKDHIRIHLQLKNLILCNQ